MINSKPNGSRTHNPTFHLALTTELISSFEVIILAAIGASEGWDIYKQSKEIIEGRYKLDQTSYKYNESVATNFEKLYN